MVVVIVVDERLSVLHFGLVWLASFSLFSLSLSLLYMYLYKVGTESIQNPSILAHLIVMKI